MRKTNISNKLHLQHFTVLSPNPFLLQAVPIFISMLVLAGIELIVFTVGSMDYILDLCWKQC